MSCQNPESRLSRPDHTIAGKPPQTTRVIDLSDGAHNIVEGDWPDRVLGPVNRAELHCYEVEDARGNAVVFAGGGYLRIMVDREGTEIAAWLNALGYNAYVVCHRLPGSQLEAATVRPRDVALDDAMEALRHIRRDRPLVLLGLSSGGHLAGTVACQTGIDPAALIIAYAPVNANHSDYKKPEGKPDYPPPEKQAFYDEWPIGLACEPRGIPKCPVFLAYGLHDEAVPVEHALNFILTARDLKLDLDCHIFGQGPHGFALRDREGSHAAWPDLAARWLSLKLGTPGYP